MLNKSLIDELTKLNEEMFRGNIDDDFLLNIQTPNFRNFPANGIIGLRSPLTAIVGRNGTGKSTVLYLAGSAFGPPKGAGARRTAGKTFNDFIPDSQKDKMPIGSCYGFIYGDNTDHKYVWHERKEGDRAGKREWDRRHKSDRKQKEVLFLGFEKNISNPFFLSDYFSLSKKSVEARLQSIGSNSTPLTAKSVKTISEISGKKYQTIERRLDPDSQFSQSCLGYIVDGEYSDVASGSGEIAIIRMVDAVLSAPERSLILIDEPESGVHQVAQEQLLEFFVKQVVGNKHQIIYTTHSQYMLEGLSPSSIILLRAGVGTKLVSPMNANRAVALQNIGEKMQPKYVALVEDDFAALWLAQILESAPATRQLVRVQPATAEGWQQMMRREFLRTYAAYKYSLNSAKPIFVLDGDVEPTVRLSELELVFGSTAKIKKYVSRHSVDALIDHISKICGKPGTINFKSILKPHLRRDENEKFLESIGEYLLHFQSNLLFLPGSQSPEVVICEWLKNQVLDSNSQICQQLLILPQDKQIDFKQQLGAALPQDQKGESAKSRISYIQTFDPPILPSVLCCWTTDPNNKMVVSAIIDSISEMCG